MANKKNLSSRIGITYAEQKKTVKILQERKGPKNMTKRSRRSHYVM